MESNQLNAKGMPDVEDADNQINAEGKPAERKETKRVDQQMERMC